MAFAWLYSALNNIKYTFNRLNYANKFCFYLRIYHRTPGLADYRKIQINKIAYHRSLI